MSFTAGSTAAGSTAAGSADAGSADPVEATPRWRDFYLAAGGRAVSYCGDFLTATALALTLQSRGDNGYGVAALMIAAVLPVAALGTVGGRIADRFDSRAIVVTAALVQAAVTAALAFTSSPAAMVALVAVVASGLALTQPTLSALTPDMVGKANLPRASAIGQAASAIGSLAGPVLGGILVGAFGIRPPLFADAASFLVLALAALLIRTRRGGRRTSAASVKAQEPQGPRWRLSQDRLLVTLIAAFGAVIMAISAVNVAELFFVRETLGGSTTVYGIVSAGWTAGMLVFAWPWGRVKSGDDRKLVLFELALLGGIAVIVITSAAVPGPLWLLPLYLIGGAFNVGLNVLAGTVVGRRAPAAVRGRVFGVFAAVSNGGNMVGYLAGGLLLAAVAPRLIMLGTGVAGLLVTGAFVAGILRPERVRPTTAAEVERTAPAPVG